MKVNRNVRKAHGMIRARILIGEIVVLVAVGIAASLFIGAFINHGIRVCLLVGMGLCMLLGWLACHFVHEEVDFRHDMKNQESGR